MEGVEFRKVPSCRGSSQWTLGYVDNGSGFGEEDRQHYRRGRRESSAHNSSSFQLLETMCTCASVLCVLWSDCTCEHVACGRCLCLHLRRAQHTFFFREHMTAHVRCEKSAPFMLHRTHLVFDVVAQHPHSSPSASSSRVSTSFPNRTRSWCDSPSARSLEQVWPNG